MPERRPIASRNSKLAARVAKALAERGISPNLISQFSMVFAAFAGMAFWLSGTTDGFWYVVCLVGAAVGCQCRLLCNLFDGMVAVEGGRGAPDGPFWNEAPDRVADALILVGLGLGTGHPGLGWAAAASAIGTAYVRELGSAQGLAADFRGPMAKPQRMAVATVAAILAIFVPMILGWSVLNLALWIIVLGSIVTMLRRSRGMIASLNFASKDEE
ncbi:CDP-alcohol phosphatidyltransferase family protein [Ruegeria sp. 2205SS24-7]|uniref:CDP-alcohol phosphatidyltransferase family protein n=1 Tax=Ruegeria discodermiae TaxID=3064389 RepID=UPI0027404420|nr:CDP-alcohol phosphatidyltransferase family protein [Ruegeria sp. 2205SS24-7]MDP5220656.1 CDP-alcohol phosphatidyltransferase family protein [Ruegeria sp. 2205SS24-7]